MVSLGFFAFVSFAGQLGDHFYIVLYESERKHVQEVLAVGQLPHICFTEQPSLISFCDCSCSPHIKVTTNKLLVPKCWWFHE